MRARQVAAVVTVAAAVGVLGVAASAGLGFGDGTSQPRPGAGLPPATARVTRATLVQTERVAGTLDYGLASTLVARAGQATLTWLPAVGTTVRPGQVVYTVDDRPVVLLAGQIPPYRDLATGVRGADVRQLERNLATFGQIGFTVDNRFTASTALAVRRWQRALGQEQTGVVRADQVAVAPGPIRVTARQATPGGPAGGPVLTYTGTTRVVTVPLDVSREYLVRPGLSATVSLPDGRTVAGTVASVGTVATTGAPDHPATVDVVVTVADQAALGALDQAPVDLMLTVARRDGVLTVPVGALVALPEGGYAVQVVANGTARYVPVRTGLFAAGRVEVTGDLTEGALVGIPQ
jgi:hypothetical protein